jgi:hypothetical protein
MAVQNIEPAKMKRGCQAKLPPMYEINPGQVLFVDLGLFYRCYGTLEIIFNFSDSKKDFSAVQSKA